MSDEEIRPTCSDRADYARKLAKEVSREEGVGQIIKII
jgi:hypothetical protein